MYEDRGIRHKNENLGIDATTFRYKLRLFVARKMHLQDTGTSSHDAFSTLVITKLQATICIWLVFSYPT
jgi:hypothetical protein